MWEEIGDNMYASYGDAAAGHAYLLVGNKTALIDSGMASSARQLKQGLSMAGVSPKGVDYIFHTHGHADNMGLDHLFSKAEIWMHPSDAQFVNEKDHAFALTHHLSIADFNWSPVHKTFVDKQVFDLDPFSLQTLFTPGHTRGGVSFIEQNKKWLFCGDTLFSTGLGRWDLPTGNKPQVISSARKILFSGPKLVLPGHGPPIKARGSASIARQLERLMTEEVPEAFY